MIKAKTGAKKPASTKTAPKKAVEKKIVSEKEVKTTVAALTAPAQKGAAKKGTKVVPTAINGVGRRKSSVARVWISKGKGDVAVNGRTLKTYFTTDQSRVNAVKALDLCGQKETFTIKINVNGGGLFSQSDAVKLGLARALVKYNEAHKQVLRDHGLLTVDARVKERKKPGQKAARRKFQFVKR